MKQIPTKVDNVGDTFNAAEINSTTFELQNAVIDSGQPLSGGDLFQTSKAMAVYAGAGDFYLDTGTATAYQLGVIGAKKYPPVYQEGQIVRFQPANSNTAAATARIDTLPVKPIKKNNGANDLEADDIVLGFETVLSYRIAATGYWELVNVVEESTESRRGIIQIATQAEVLAATSADKAVVPAYLPQHIDNNPGVAKAWVTFNGGDGSIYEKHNVTGVTRVSTGIYTVNLSVTFTNLFYCCHVDHGGDNGDEFKSIKPNSTSSAGIVTNANGARADYDYVTASFFGTLATP